MRKILLAFIVCMMLFACKKDNEEIKGTRDLKNLSLPQLKTFLAGKWRFQMAKLKTIGGLKEWVPADSVKSYYFFYPKDSLMRFDTITHINSSPTNVAIREKVVYKYLNLAGFPGLSANVLMFANDGYGYRNKWVADTLINDTLVFADYFNSEGVSKYYFTKEQ